MTTENNPEPFNYDHDKETGENPCCICGREAGKYRALVIDGGARFGDPAREDPTARGYMGWYPVGSRCRRKLPNDWTLPDA